ncbi:hypothetical protein N8T08_007222 [Aspergillus melleus]|uniref:Uncharacterized protein n=1 Tax=Aspergillus melleus TaxID=138277 RepID=A0ACC3AYU0_9EURO|nr:hypothetical protein N8T08_007222 [Aspergillus melleus]
MSQPQLGRPYREDHHTMVAQNRRSHNEHATDQFGPTAEDDGAPGLNDEQAAESELKTATAT